MNSLLSAPMNYEDLMTGSLRAGEDSTTHSCAPIITRIEWCQSQVTKARMKTEVEEWCAEKEGLTDALLNRDCTYKYQHRPPSVGDRYELGLEDGRALIRIGSVERVYILRKRRQALIDQILNSENRYTALRTRIGKAMSNQALIASSAQLIEGAITSGRTTLQCLDRSTDVLHRSERFLRDRLERTSAAVTSDVSAFR